MTLRRSQRPISHAIAYDEASPKKHSVMASVVTPQFETGTFRSAPRFKAGREQFEVIAVDKSIGVNIGDVRPGHIAGHK